MGLIEAVRAHSLDELKLVLAKDSGAVKREGRDALFEAVAGSDIAIVKHLIEYSGVNLRDRDKDGNTVLHYGAASGNEELVRYLVEWCGCNPMEDNLSGITPFDIAHQVQVEEVEQYFATYCGTNYEETYHNPIRCGFYPDPSIVRVGEDYYMVNSSFCFFPCIPISHSKDLIHWEVIGYTITKPEYSRLEELEGGRGYWAPDISYCNGRFYVTATYRLNEVNGIRRIQMVTSSQCPEGPYDEPAFIEEDGIDPSIFHDDDGRHYMILNRGARILELSPDCKQRVSDARLLWYGDYKVNPEGPHIIKKDGWYYLFLAEGGTGKKHQITVARSLSLMGPYESCPYNPILTQRNSEALIQCSGHGMPVMTQDGRWYMVYLCLRIPGNGYGILGRETCLDPMTWTLDGWPIINGGRGPSGQQRLPLPPMGPRGETVEAWRETQKKSEGSCIDLEDSMWLVHRHGKCACTKTENGDTVIRGNGTDLCSLACDAMLLRRQQDFCFKAECVVESHSALRGDTGLTCYYDENSYLKLGMTLRDGIHYIGVWEYVDNSYRNEKLIALEEISKVESPLFLQLTNREIPVCLRITTEYLKRTCSYCLPNCEWKDIIVLEDTSYLSSEGLVKGKRFTGALVGLYASYETVGRFSSFRYTALQNY